MRIEVTKLGIKIVPENAQDVIYIENFLNLKKDEDHVKCVRKNAMDLSCIAYLEIQPNN